MFLISIETMLMSNFGGHTRCIMGNTQGANKILSTAISRRVVGKNVHVTIPKGNMGYDQYTVPAFAAVEPTFVAFL